MKKKETYSFADPVFYESPHLAKVGARLFFDISGYDPPDGWQRRHHDLWITLFPPGSPGTGQGWKIHVSAVPDNVERVLEVVWKHCVARRVMFKFLPDRRCFLALNGKGADREASGKVATLYPAGDQLRPMLEELSEVLGGEPGPYILSDLRWRTGPLYVRYGGFAARRCFGPDGEVRLAVEDPDSGLVPDRREPYFEVPPWVQVPDFLAPQLAARRDGELDRLPYRIRRALHFSNGGGVYLAERRSDGRRVVLKEARPLAALDRDGQDAVARMEREALALSRLADIPGVPALYDRFTAGEHHFLVVQHLPGLRLRQWIDLNNPLMGPPGTRDDVIGYRDAALAVLGRIEQLVGAIHERGLLHGDLHPNNLMVGPGDTVSLVDYELATDIADNSYRPALRFPGFAPSSGKTGVAVDLHALAMLRYWMFLPLHTVLELVPEKAEEFVTEVERRFELPGGYGNEIVGELMRAGPPAKPSPAERRRQQSLGAQLEVDLGAEEPDRDGIRTSMAEAIRASATPERTDRLFPGSFEQFVSGGVGFAYGVAGVLWALSVSGIGRFPAYEQWLLEAVRRDPGRRPGFYDGLHGVAYVLDHLGHRDQALEALERTIPLTRRLHAGNLFNGLAGVGLNLLHFGGFEDELTAIADRLAETVDGAELPGTGLLRGWSGIGLFFLRMYQHTRDDGYLDLATRAIHHDLDSCGTSVRGGLTVVSGTRPGNDLEQGSAGIALVADELVAHRADDRVLVSLPLLVHACRQGYVDEVSLLDGRAGLLEVLSRFRPDDARESLRRLAWHAVPYHGHLAFPRHYRLTMDLAHGTAGVLLVVSGRGFLPFLGRRLGAWDAGSTSAWQEAPAECCAEPDADTSGMAVLDLQRLPLAAACRGQCPDSTKELGFVGR